MCELNCWAKKIGDEHDLFSLESRQNFVMVQKKLPLNRYSENLSKISTKFCQYSENSKYNIDWISSAFMLTNTVHAHMSGHVEFFIFFHIVSVEN